MGFRYKTQFYGEGFITEFLDVDRDKHQHCPQLEESLNEMAAEGWELISMLQTRAPKFGWCYLAVFRREGA